MALAALLSGGWLWLRDSSLVAVEHVSVTGQTGPDAGRIRAALVSAARNMTTLDVRMGQLRMAVAPYAVVKDLRVSTQFPHGLHVHVIEERPVGAIVVDDRTIAVAEDGTLLRDVLAGPSLPLISERTPPGGARLTDPSALGAVALLAAAPRPLLTKVGQVTTVADHGLVAQIRDGPSIYFGDPTELQAKWIAVSDVLADSSSEGASYIDVSDPARPAAGSDAAPGGGSGQAATTGAGLGASAAAGDSQTASAGDENPGGATAGQQ